VVQGAWCKARGAWCLGLHNHGGSPCTHGVRHDLGHELLPRGGPDYSVHRRTRATALYVEAGGGRPGWPRAEITSDLDRSGKEKRCPTPSVPKFKPTCDVSAHTVRRFPSTSAHVSGACSCVGILRRGGLGEIMQTRGRAIPTLTPIIHEWTDECWADECWADELTDESTHRLTHRCTRRQPLFERNWLGYERPPSLPHPIVHCTLLWWNVLRLHCCSHLRT